MGRKKRVERSGEKETERERKQGNRKKKREQKNKNQWEIFYVQMHPGETEK